MESIFFQLRARFWPDVTTAQNGSRSVGLRLMNFASGEGVCSWRGCHEGRRPVLRSAPKHPWRECYQPRDCGLCRRRRRGTDANHLRHSTSASRSRLKAAPPKKSPAAQLWAIRYPLIGLTKRPSISSAFGAASRLAAIATATFRVRDGYPQAILARTGRCLDRLCVAR